MILILAENALFHDIGRIFQPVFEAVGWTLAFIYGLIPNYAVAIALLTVIVMALLTPLTIKSTRSMIAMQELQPEIKKLQAKYKGAENRQKLNEELMALYKQKGINPAGGCIPLFLQMPFLIILYDTIRGLTNVETINGVQQVVPRYIPKPPANATTYSLVEKLYHSLAHPVVPGHGIMVSFGIDLANKPFGHGLTAAQRIPYFVLVALAVGFQYFQMRQMNRRNPQAAAANKQMQTIQKLTPILFAYIYFLIPAAVVLYMIVSTIIRILTQEVMFRTGMVQPAGGERTIGGGKLRLPGITPAPGLVEKTEEPAPPPEVKGNGSGTKGRTPPRNRPAAGKATTNGNTGGANKRPPPHPRARNKRPRKAR